MLLLRTHNKGLCRGYQRTKQVFKEAVDPGFRCTELSSKAWSSKELIMLTDVVHNFKKEKKCCCRE